MNDKFGAVKAILEQQERQDDNEIKRLSDKIKLLRDGCEEISKITADDHGNGLQLAIMIASKVLQDSADDF